MSSRPSMLRRWLRGQKAPASVQRALARAVAELPAASTEVEACSNCGRTFFLADLDNLSTQESFLLLCTSCSDLRFRLKAAGEPHIPSTGWLDCVCGEPEESPYHLQPLKG